MNASIPRWRGVLPAVLGVAALSLTVLPTAAFAAHTEVTSGDDLVTSVRWSGETRYDTASKLAVEGTEAAISTPANAAILATGNNFPDALAGSYLSGVVGGPILLTDGQTLSPETRARLTSTEASGLSTIDTIYLLGGPVAISQAVEDEVKALGFEVVRYDGETRIDTAAQIATEAPEGTVGEVDGMATVIVARADNFPDALVAGAAARFGSLPLLLTNTNDLPQATIDALDELGAEQVLIPGGPVAISTAVEQQIKDLGYETTRIEGETRRDTAVDFATFNQDKLGFTADEVALARGDFYPDALTVAPYAGREGFSILLSESPTVLGTETASYLTSLAACTTDTLYIPGGPLAISPEVETLARTALTTADDCTDVDNQDPTLVGAQAVTSEDAPGGRALPNPGDDAVNVIFDEAVTGEDTAPGQFRYLADDGTVTAATSVQFDDSEQALLGFPAGTVTEGEGSIEYKRAGDPDVRVYDLAGNEAVNNVVVELTEDFTVDSTADAVDANIGDGECATTDGDCTLRAAVQEANSDPDFNVINVVPGTYALTITGADEDEAATGDLDITTPMNILGSDAGTTIVDADGLEDDRVFDVSTGTSRLEGLTLTNGEVTGETDRGGAIRVTGEDTVLTIANSVISDSTAPQAGGGLENTGATVTLEGTDLTGNTTGETPNPGNGGGLHAAGGITDVTGGTVQANVAEEGGGFWVGGGTLAVDGTTFDANIAEGGDTTAGARQGGGAIFNVNGTLDVTNAIFTGNTALGEDAEGDAGSGGAIMTTTEGEEGAATTDVTTSSFTGNEADRAGGAIENDGAAVLTVLDSTFDGNSATAENSAGNGGAIHTIGDATVSGDTDTNLATGNTAVEGGAFWVGGGATLTVNGTTFDANASNGETADEGDRKGGGAIYNDGATLNVTDGVFTANTAIVGAGSGGAILTTAAGMTSVDTSSFEANQADRAGGAIENDGASMLTVNDSTFDANEATGANSAGNGGAIHDGGSTTTITGDATTATGNIAVEGGAFWVSGTMTVLDATLLNNTASSAGTSLYNSGGTLTITNVSATVDALPLLTSGVTLLEDEGDGTTTTVTEGGGNTLNDGDDTNPTCNVEVGDTDGGNTDDDASCFTDTTL